MYSTCIKLPGEVSGSDIEKISEALVHEAGAFSAFREGNSDTGPWMIALITPDIPDKGILKAVTGSDTWQVEVLPEIDWLEHSYRQFPPFSVGPFFIYGSHYKGEIPDGQTGLQIDAATAFGSGEHGTTKGCLLAMLELEASGLCPWNVLDMGTGSGILALAAYKLWKTPVLGIDNDEVAVKIACHHRAINHVADSPTGVVFETGDGFAAASVQAQKPFDLIIANILAGPLKDMAGALKAVSDDNGYVILSGILDTQAQDVLSVYEKSGFIPVKNNQIGTWSTLVLRKA